MPLYEYRCSKCTSVFEVIHKFSDEPLTEHAGCGGPVERLISAPGLHFKGSGWYITDYKNSGSKKAEGADKSESKTDDKKDSKPAAAETAKAESKPAVAAKSSE